MKFTKALFLKFSVIIAMALMLCTQSYAADTTSVNVGINQSEEIILPGKFTNTVISNRAIAGVIKHSAKSISIVGKAAGETEISFLNKKKLVKKVSVSVGQNTASSSSASKHNDVVSYEEPVEPNSNYVSGKYSNIKRSLKNFFPSEAIGIESVNGAIALTGTVSDAETAAQALKIVQEYAGKSKIINLMRLRSGQQVMLRVRVGELKRSSIDKLGLGLHGIISAGSSVFGLLESKGDLKILAEPTLTAISGETANFLAGGEFPVPVVQSGNTMSVDYKPFGVSVNFTPMVFSKNRIRLDVASEVSELSDKSSVKVNSMVIPSITTRRANTTVELAPGESFMIAGLIKDNSKANIHKVPGLGDIPILSPLFRSAEFQKNETELVIAVTPYLADPVASDDIRLPTDDFKNATPLEMLFMGKLESRKSSDTKKKGLEGSVGYLID
ncbi:MAG: type and secretion system protein family protein [Rickettsiaceae bacterium]|jgi:pilus assembly protein CpaC|nr:type and secretion system protein family protein [Rickettsiaceae bacterium]